MEKIYLNDDWYFAQVYDDALNRPDYDVSSLNKIRIPHSVCETPFSYFDEHMYQMISGYRRELWAPESWRGQKLILTFMGAAHDSIVYINGKAVGSHHCGYTAFSIDITKHIHIGKSNLIVVKLDSNETLNIPPFGYVMDYMTYGGIYRDVYLEIVAPTHIEDVFITASFNAKTLISKIEVVGDEYNEITQSISEHKQNNFTKLDTKKNGSEFTAILPDAKAWSVDEPNLYDVKTALTRDGVIISENITTVGFRDIEFNADGFYLNGNKIKLLGLNRHQSFPYVGYAMPKSVQENDARFLKKELGLNIVRTSHYPQSHDFINACDELGLLVLTEIPGWQHIGNEAWKEQAIKNTEDMVKQYRNHPSIIMWGVRINESSDDDEFYRRTNEAAKNFDTSRPTCGVRAHKKSSLLEDVYTYNDFVHEGDNIGCEPKKKVTSDMSKGYMITEHNGHMYPTKSYDDEEQRLSQALRHANVIDAVRSNDDIAGCIGWCMSDYNTHKDFGSGDRICYHGISDMFRNQKLAAKIYACEQDDIPVLELSSAMDLGEHPACNRGETYIFTNADSVKMYKNGLFIKEYTHEGTPYKNLKRGPIVIDDYIGNALLRDKRFKPKQAEYIKEILNYAARFGYTKLSPRIYLLAAKLMLRYHMKPYESVALYNQYVGDWGGISKVYRFEAYKDGVLVKTIVKEAVTDTQLDVDVDHTELCEEHSYDVASVRIRMVDQNNNILSFYNEPITLSTTGPVSVIGPTTFSLKGGMGGTYIKTTGESGAATLTLSTVSGKTKTIDFIIK